MANFEGGGGGGRALAEKKRNFWSKLSRIPFLACFLKTLPAAQKIFLKTGSLHCFWRARKIKLVNVKKSAKFSNFFEKTGPLEKILSPPRKISAAEKKFCRSYVHPG